MIQRVTLDSTKPEKRFRNLTVYKMNQDQFRVHALEFNSDHHWNYYGVVNDIDIGQSCTDWTDMIILIQ